MKGLFNDAFQGKTVLVTGHTGFKGSWLSIWLRELRAKVIGYALEPYTAKDNYNAAGLNNRMVNVIGDIRDYQTLKKVFDNYQPEIVFHLAAQPLVRLSYSEPKLTYDTNIGGTVNILECCRLTDSVKVIINITSDKCYEDRHSPRGFRETDRMGGYDPYSSSKGCCELITSAYRNSFFHPDEFNKHCKALSSVRAGNVIGGGDWRQDRLIPDCIKALKNNEPVGIRSPKAVRPWQFVLEPLSGYLLLASKMLEDGQKYADAWNFGPERTSCIAVEEVVKNLIQRWGSGSYNDLSIKSLLQPHESKVLMLDIAKVKKSLGWKPALTIDEAIQYTVDWYKTPDIDYDFCVKQINDYSAKALERRSHGNGRR
jgi:CDP-glucose 4,6-dehydratase